MPKKGLSQQLGKMHIKTFPFLNLQKNIKLMFPLEKQLMISNKNKKKRKKRRSKKSIKKIKN